MTNFTYNEKIRLFVEGRIPREDAERQQKTAIAILERLRKQPGVILADEVGMGKTFVALAVAVSIILNNKNEQVVIMVPATLKDKWPRDFDLFAKRCLPTESGSCLSSAVVDRPVEFLKLLDDPPERKKSLIFLTHGAMSRGISDGLVKLALIKKSIYKRKNIDSLKTSLHRHAGDLIGMKYLQNYDSDIWEKLFSNDYSEWRNILKKSGIISGNKLDTVLDDDDPVPEAIINALENIESDAIFEAIKEMPLKETKHFNENLKEARRTINDELHKIWKICIKNLKVKIPLLIFDEAHHLKNTDTRISSLFRDKGAEEDAVEIEKGPFAGIFNRMLFLTATPFQLGHHELCNVLDRFKSINWDSDDRELMEKELYVNEVDGLRERLDKSQAMSLLLDSAWGRLKFQDLQVDGVQYTNAHEWWSKIHDKAILTEAARIVLERYKSAKYTLKVSEEKLKPWVIRNLKKKTVYDVATKKHVDRRALYIGDSILTHDIMTSKGLKLDKDKILPFMIAARAAVSMPEKRPVFAEGLSSSYEAFLHTSEQRKKIKQRKQDEKIMDSDEDVQAIDGEMNSVGEWYIDQLESCVKEDMSGHPKVEATLKRVIDLWKSGEKVLVFCHYVQTGRCLRQHISRSIESTLEEIGSEKMGCKKEEVMDICKKISERLERDEKDSPMKRVFENTLKNILAGHPLLAKHAKEITNIVNKYVRTPSFLVRFYPFTKTEDGRFDENNIEKAFETLDNSEMKFRDILEEFLKFISERCEEKERIEYIESLNSIQMASHTGADVMQTFTEDEQVQQGEKLLANVRLINGKCKPETRKKLMLAFNSPFYPEILICSSVMSEGVDLQKNCRYIIHHDLCWNPSTLEQRTGRVDRIGAKMERCLKPIYVYMPFVSETQDQRMFKVVMDREKWFKIVMGEECKDDYKSTEKQAERIPLPDQIVNELSFKLGI